VRRIRPSALAIALLLLPGAPSLAHDWGTLAESSPTPQELGVILSVAEEVQAEALAEGPRALASDALAADWLGWLTGAAGLDRSGELASLADRLVAAGAVAADERALAPDVWRHGLEHLALAWDARALGANRARAEAAEARLRDPGLPTEESVRLSYLAALGRGAASSAPPPEALLARLGALLEAARRAEGQR